MDANDRAALSTLARGEAFAAVSALAAAERAVEAGRLNAAKVLRAAALSSRVRALALERVASANDTTSMDIASLLESTGATLASLGALADPGTGGLQASLDALQSSQHLLQRTHDALAKGRDVRESEVAQFLWGCAECGLLVEAARPEICPACGSIGGDFELFAPFFSATGDHLARRRPSEIVEMLTADAAHLAQLLKSVPEDELRERAADGEWCMKEIAGHMIDIAELFGRRARATLDPNAPSIVERTPLPWKLIDGQDYPETSIDDILRRFRAAMDDALAVVATFDDKDWRRKGELSVGRISLIDMASWLANHNLAHAKQIADLRSRRTEQR